MDVDLSLLGYRRRLVAIGISLVAYRWWLTGSPKASRPLSPTANS